MNAAPGAMPVQIGAVLNGRYRITSFLGKGGMGEVYEAVQLDLGRTVAVKVLSSVAGSKDRARFVNEATATASLAHPNIVQVFELGYADDTPFLVMERLHGSSLRDVLVNRGPIEPARARAIAVQMLGALDAAHHHRIHHRDIKPGNVFIVEGPGVRDFAKVLDFGIAKLVDDPGAPVTTTGTLLGTLAYISPERLRGDPGDERADLYAVGLCLHEMIHGRRLFTGAGPELIGAILRGAPTIHGPLGPVIARAIAADPARRFRSAAEMCAALETESIESRTSAAPGPWLGAAPDAPTATIREQGMIPEIPVPSRAATERPPAQRASQRVLVPLIVALVVVLLAIVAVAALIVHHLVTTSSRPLASAPAETSAASPPPSPAATNVAPSREPPVRPSSSAASRTAAVPRASANAAPPATPAAGGRCMCIKAGRTFSLCPPSSVVAVPMCRCTTAGGILLAKTSASVDESSASAIRGAPGSPCQGFATATSPIESGTLTSCNFCEGTTRAYAGPSNTACTGIDTDGKTVSPGLVLCP